MRRLPLLVMPCAALLSWGCLSTSVVLHVNADATGTATVTTRLYLSGLQAFDGLFPGEAPARPPQVEEELPAPGVGLLESEFGTPVRLVSSRLDRAPDGGIRTTEVAFDDVRKLQMRFPPIFMGGGRHLDMVGTLDPALMTFAIRRHDNGDRMLLVKLPDPRMANQPDAPITEFKTDSPEERLIKQAIKNMSLNLSVEIDQPLLRSNAPQREGNRATILDLDLDRMINAMDETRARRMVAPGSFQEMLWQVGDLPGAIVPTDREIFLEYEEPAQQPPPPPPVQTPAAPAAPDTEIYLAPLSVANGQIVVGRPENITTHPGYDNQPQFTPDGQSILFTSMRPAPALRDNPDAPQTDIFRYEIASKTIARVTQTPESEYSPTPMLDGQRTSVVRVEMDGTQRLATITPTGPKVDVEMILPEMSPVGYHAWTDDHTVALFILGEKGGPATLQVVDTTTGRLRVLATDIGRSLQRMPGTGASRHLSFVQRERSGESVTLVVKELDPATGAITTLTPAVAGSTEADLAWMPDGTLLMVKSDVLYAWRRGQSGWKDVAQLSRLGLHGVTRLAVSPAGDRLALVGVP